MKYGLKTPALKATCQELEGFFSTLFLARTGSGSVRAKKEVEKSPGSPAYTLLHAPHGCGFVFIRFQLKDDTVIGYSVSFFHLHYFAFVLKDGADGHRKPCAYTHTSAYACAYTYPVYMYLYMHVRMHMHM